MLNLSESTLHYIENTFIDIVKEDIYQSFTLLENFGLKFYEDKYIDLISKSDTISNDDKADNFTFMLKGDIRSIITDHCIYLDNNVEVKLNELNEIAHFLYIIQNLEDYELVSYRLHAQDTPKNIIVDLIAYYSLLTRSRLLEIVDVVEEILIKTLQMFIEDKTDNISSIESKHIKHIKLFFSFINNTDCLGLRFFNEGYVNITLEDIVNLINIDLTNYINELILTNSAQAALDVLSILIICKDTYEIPLLKFKQLNFYFTNKLENVTKLESIMFNMLNDFNMFLEVEKQKEVANA